MKTLDTLISDIYEKLEGLSNGEGLEIPEKELDITLSRIKDGILSWSTPSERNSSFTLRMSNIGKPARQLWYESKDENNSSAPSAPTQIKFLYGHILEEIVLMLVRMSGHMVTDEQKEVEINGIKGHIDSKIDGEVVDIKTASKFAFKKFQDGTLADNDLFGYLAQLSAYETAENTSNGGFLVINKESGELCLFRPDDIEKPKISNQIDVLKTQLSLDTPPERCYDPIPEGKKGNMKLPSPCNYCAYKHECHKDANDNRGLRSFQYSGGLAYFTKVVVEPRVEEIL